MPTFTPAYNITFTYTFNGMHKIYHHGNDDPFTRWSLSSEIEAMYGRIVVCLSQEQLDYSTKFTIH